MKYFYELFDSTTLAKKMDGCLERIESFEKFPVSLVIGNGQFLRVTNLLTNRVVNQIATSDMMCEWLEILQREDTWYKQPGLKVKETDISFGSETQKTISELNTLYKDIQYGNVQLVSDIHEAQRPKEIDPTDPSDEVKGPRSVNITDWPAGTSAKTMADLTGTTEGFSANYDTKGNAKHYQDVVPGLQYIDTMAYLLRDKVGLEAHLFGQIYKYMMRSGKKDKTVQEVSKAKWYMDYLVAYLKAGRPITTSEVHHLLAAESIL